VEWKGADFGAANQRIGTIAGELRKAELGRDRLKRLMSP
jgi:hypothetical protein